MKLAYESPSCYLCQVCAEDVLNFSLESPSGMSVVEKSSGDNWDW